jgi:alpha-L-fucosidase 2
LKLTLDKYDAWETRELPLDLTYKQLRGYVESGDRKKAEECMRTESLYGDAPRPTRLPMPRLEIDFGAPFKWDLGRLRLQSATAEISGEAGGDGVKIQALVHANENVIQLCMTGPGAVKAKPRVSLDHLNDAANKTLKTWGYPEPEVIESDDSGSLVLKAPTGYQYAVAWRKTTEGMETVLTLAILSTSDDPDPLSAAKALASRKVDIQGHLDWWKEYWNRSFLRVPDARLESLY